MPLVSLQTRILTQPPPGVGPPPPPGSGPIFIVASFTSWDVSDSMNPVQEGSAVLGSSNLAQVVLSGSTVWACSASNGPNVLRALTSIDVSNPSAPAVLGSVDLG